MAVVMVDGDDCGEDDGDGGDCGDGWWRWLW